MRRIGWRVIVIVVAALAVAAATLYVTPARLSQSQLESAPLARIPAQPIPATVECRSGLNISVIDVGRDWSVIQDHPPCALGGIVLAPVNATAAEMSRVSQRPLVTFKVTNAGLATEGSIVRSSGSNTLDARALRQVMTTRYPRQYCGICKLSMEINVEFQWPLWFRDNGNAR